MTWFRIGLACVVSVALAACHKTEQGVLQPMVPLAGLRYVNLLSDTSAVDFRIVNFIGDAPNAGAASFRTGGSPNGISNNYLPPHWPVEAGRDVQIRVFMNGLDPAVSSLVVLDTTVQFAENVNYTFFLYGFTKSGGAKALITADTAPTPAAGKIAMRFLNLAPSFAGAIPALADTTVKPDFWVGGPTTVAPFAGTAAAVNLAYGAFSGYKSYDTSSTYRVSLTPTGVPGTVIVAAPVSRGVLGTATANPVAGANVPGTAITAVIVPRSVAGTTAPQSGNPTLRTPAAGAFAFASPNVTISTGTVTTLTNRSGGAADSTTGTTGFNHSLANGDVIYVAGATEPEYNGWQIATKADSLTLCNPTNAGDTSTRCAAANVLATTTYRLRYRIGATPANTPATGTPTYRAYITATQAAPASTNYLIPWIVYLIDKKPAFTAP